MKPRLSVVMPVFNSSAFLAEAIESVLTQTVGDFELLVLDDASTDDSVNIARSFDDSRIKLLEHPENRGIAFRLNEGLSVARADVIARMDADDVSLPNRFEVQLRALESNPEVSLVGSQIRLFEDVDGSRRLMPGFTVATRPAQIRWRLFFGNSIGHMTVMARRRFYEDLGGYDPALRSAQDYDLWLRANPRYLMSNLDQVLVMVRVHGSNLSRINSDIRARNAESSLRKALVDVLGEDVSPDIVRVLMNPRSIVDRQASLENAERSAVHVSQITRYCLKSHRWTAAEGRAIRRDATELLTKIVTFAARRNPALAARILRNNEHISIGSLAASLLRTAGSRSRAIFRS